HALSSDLDRDVDDAEPLITIKSWSRAGSSARHKQMHARADLPFEQRPQCWFVDGAISAERRHQSGATTAKFHVYSITPTSACLASNCTAAFFRSLRPRRCRTCFRPQTLAFAASPLIEQLYVSIA